MRKKLKFNILKDVEAGGGGGRKKENCRRTGPDNPPKSALPPSVTLEGIS